MSHSLDRAVQEVGLGKYEPLTGFLAGQNGQEAPMTFAEIEAVIGSPLPASKRHPAWWSNNASNNVMTRAWLAAGFKTERVDIVGEKLVFRRATEVSPPPTPAGEDTFLGRLRAALGGTVKIMPGVDITAPMGERWSALED